MFIRIVIMIELVSPAYKNREMQVQSSFSHQVQLKVALACVLYYLYLFQVYCALDIFWARWVGCDRLLVLIFGLGWSLQGVLDWAILYWIVYINKGSFEIIQLSKGIWENLFLNKHLTATYYFSWSINPSILIKSKFNKL